MKKRLTPLLLTLFILASCSSSALSLSEIETILSDIQNKMNPNLTLQLLTDGSNSSYINFHSKGMVAADIETQRETLILKLDESELQENMKQHVYKLTAGPEHKNILVHINGKSVPFDSVTSF
ncbi:hypothetical protein [Bacillus massiliglaciei]|uniref:hypothetical protein n=1 Tax=Bacillus massiliglaciei TaxID=1816693 RepID=UPI000DA5EE18|nr:hypothetical protein [Bacillus massiliglaciei]